MAEGTSAPRLPPRSSPAPTPACGSKVSMIATSPGRSAATRTSRTEASNQSPSIGPSNVIGATIRSSEARRPGAWSCAGHANSPSVASAPWRVGCPSLTSRTCPGVTEADRELPEKTQSIQIGGKQLQSPFRSICGQRVIARPVHGLRLEGAWRHVVKSSALSHSWNALRVLATALPSRDSLRVPSCRRVLISASRHCGVRPTQATSAHQTWLGQASSGSVRRHGSTLCSGNGWLVFGG